MINILEQLRMNAATERNRLPAGIELLSTPSCFGRGYQFAFINHLAEKISEDYDKYDVFSYITFANYRNNDNDSRYRLRSDMNRIMDNRYGFYYLDVNLNRIVCNISLILWREKSAAIELLELVKQLSPYMHLSEGVHE